MRAAGLICDLRRLKFVHLSERKGVCDTNALNFVILRLKNALNSSILAFSKALSAKSVVNSACGIAWQSKATQRKRKAMRENANLAKHNTAWRGEFDNETAQRGKIQRHSKASKANSVWQTFAGKTAHGKFGLVSVAKWAVLVGKAGKAKMGQCLGGGPLSLSLSLSLVTYTF